MDWDIQYQSKVLQSIGERIFLYSEEFLLKSLTSTVIAWRRNIPYSLAVRKMIEEINAFQA